MVERLFLHEKIIFAKVFLCPGVQSIQKMCKRLLRLMGWMVEGKVKMLRNQSRQ